MKKQAKKIIVAGLVAAMAVTGISAPQSADAAAAKVKKVVIKSGTKKIKKVTLYAGKGVHKRYAKVTLKSTVTMKKKSAKKTKTTWKTSKKKVAKISKKKGANTVVTAKKAGKSVITAKAGKKKATVKVTVKKIKKKITNVTLNTGDLNLNAGASFTLKAGVAPSKATLKAVEYTSSNKSVVSVTRNGKLTATINAVAAGTATVTATACDGSGKTAKINVTVGASGSQVTTVPVVSPTVAPTATVAPTVSPTVAPTATVAPTESAAPASEEPVESVEPVVIKNGEDTLLGFKKNGVSHDISIADLGNSVSGALKSIFDIFKFDDQLKTNYDRYVEKAINYEHNIDREGTAVSYYKAAKAEVATLTLKGSGFGSYEGIYTIKTSYDKEDLTLHVNVIKSEVSYMNLVVCGAWGDDDPEDDRYYSVMVKEYIRNGKDARDSLNYNLFYVYDASADNEYDAQKGVQIICDSIMNDTDQREVLELYFGKEGNADYTYAKFFTGTINEESNKITDAKEASTYEFDGNDVKIAIGPDLAGQLGLEEIGVGVKPEN